MCVTEVTETTAAPGCSALLPNCSKSSCSEVRKNNKKKTFLKAETGRKGSRMMMMVDDSDDFPHNRHELEDGNEDDTNDWNAQPASQDDSNAI